MNLSDDLATVTEGQTTLLLRTLLAQTRDLVAVVDQDFRLLVCNAAYTAEFRRLYGQTPVIGDDVRLLVAHLPEQAARAEQAWARALQGEEFTVTRLVGDPEGWQEAYEFSYGQLHVNGELAAFHIARCVTERVRKEEEAQRRAARLETEVAEQQARLARVTQTLRERRERLSAALSVADAGTFRHDVRKQLGYWDENLQHYFGVELQERPRPLEEFLQIVHPRDRAGVRATMEGGAHETGPRSGIFRVVLSNGEVRWLQFRAQVFAGKDGKPANMIGACADITALKQAEHALKERERRLQELADHMLVVVWTQRADLSLEYVNRRWREYSGFDLQASYNGGWRQIVHPDDLAAVDAAMQKADKQGGMLELECRLRRGDDGVYRWHLVRIVPALDREGRLERWYGTAVDIEERVQNHRRMEQIQSDLQRANSDLAHTLARFEGIVSSISDGLMLFDADGCRLIANPAARRMHGIPLDADIRKGQYRNLAGADVCDLEGNPVPLEAWPSSRALNGEIFSGVELRLRRLNSGVEWIASFSGAPIYDNRGQQIYAVITFRDVSERRAAEQALQAAVEARDRFLSVASHELRTPLTTLVMQLQMARRRIDPEQGTAPPPAELAKTLDIANRQTARLAKLVDDLLDVSRSGMGRLEFSFQPTDLGQLVAEVGGQFAVALEHAGCQLTMDLEDDVVGEWDAARLEQVVGNLLSNAIKYAGGTAIHLEVRRRDAEAMLMVRDYGPGVPTASREKVFARFERYVEDTAITGLGLGLFLAREIIHGHSGTIELAATEGPGACFIVTLPLQPPAQGALGS